MLVSACAVGPDFKTPEAPKVTGYAPQPLPEQTSSAATQGGEAQRNDETWCSVSAWQTGPDGGHTRRTEPLTFSLVPMQVRDYR